FRRRFLETLRRVADGAREIEDILSSKDALRVRQGVAALLHAVSVIEDLRLLLPERVVNPIFGPDVKRALSLLFRLLCVLGAFGVLGGIETAFFADHVSQRISKGFAGDGGVKLIAGDLVGVEIRGDQLRLIVEHLLEVRRSPLAVYRIAIKAPAHV